jgi:predicted DNA-binding protein
MTTMNLELEDSLFQLLNKTAILLGKNSIDLAREVITYYLEDVEDMRLAQNALGRLEKGESSTISLDELEKCLVR